MYHLHILPESRILDGDRWHEISEQPVNSKDTRLPVIVVEGKTKMLIGMISCRDLQKKKCFAMFNRNIEGSACYLIHIK